MKALLSQEPSRKPPTPGMPSSKQFTNHTGKKAGVFARSLSAYEVIRSKVENEMIEKQTGASQHAEKHNKKVSIGL